MPITVREYDTRIDSRRRVTLRGSVFNYYHVSEMDDGRIILDPRELSTPFSVSANTLRMMDSAMNNLNDGAVSEPIDLSAFAD